MGDGSCVRVAVSQSNNNIGKSTVEKYVAKSARRRAVLSKCYFTNANTMTGGAAKQAILAPELIDRGQFF